MPLWERLLKNEDGVIMRNILIALLIATALVVLLMLFSPSIRNMVRPYIVEPGVLYNRIDDRPDWGKAGEVGNNDD